MYVKIINPATNGKKVYANAGSARRTTNYLEQEAKEQGQTATFFSSAAKGGLTADEVVDLVDNNHKGLGKDAAKFYSLVLSPSADELTELGNDARALERYTQNVMELYAKNFNLKGGRELGESELVWAATIHQDRKNRGTDAGVQGELKPGLQTHVHVIVSARDAAQQITLNPLGAATRFNRVQFQAQAGAQLDEELGRTPTREVGAPAPTRQQRVKEKAADITERAASNRAKKPLTPEQLAAKDARLDAQVARLNSKLDPARHLDPEQVKLVAKERGYDNVFYLKLGNIERNAEKGRTTHEPDEYLRTGRVAQVGMLKELPSERLAYTDPVRRTGQASPSQPATMQSLKRSVANISRALTPPTRTQDVRREEEKTRDYEPEM
ncbi:DUF5712 family protein [Hymenobacter psoromatis]|uniref:DUF5712 family protein n=1 Tax=Hymenobacter psoromatis TaxID=1484116 RepID=UPI001CBED053|nr:DUF5712 family protein [Hymenobacter psoromatis]